MMVLRQDADHAIRILLLLADENASVTVSSLARSAGASVAFIHKIVQRLRRHGIVCTRRGAGGGVTLAASPRSISLLAVVEAIQGRITFARCNNGRRPCPRHRSCRLSYGLEPIEKQFTSLMQGTTLEQLQVASGSRRGGRK